MLRKPFNHLNFFDAVELARQLGVACQLIYIIRVPFKEFSKL